MTFDGVILYGPPASGKDTVTAELCQQSDAYVYFEKLKAGQGSISGYRLAEEGQLADLRSRGLIIHEVARYGAVYAVDSVHLGELFKAGRIPIVHMGQLAGVNAMRQHGHWLDVLLWCSRDVAMERLRARGSADIDDRMAAWDETRADLESDIEPRFTLSVRTDALMPGTTAEVVHAAMTGR